jgi:hypothetical protein
MPNPFRKFPIATLVAWGGAVFSVLVVLQGTGLLTGSAAHWVDVAAGALQLILTTYAHQHVTPVASPRDAVGHRLVPAPLIAKPTAAPPSAPWQP